MIIDIEVTASTVAEAAEKIADIRANIKNVDYVTVKLSDEKRDKTLDILNSGIEKNFAKLNKN